MMRGLLTLIVWLALVAPGLPQALNALARVEVSESGIKDGWRGRTELRLGLTQGVPYRVFVLDAPARLVVDFREVDFAGLAPGDILTSPGRVQGLRFGAFQPGWSRLVARLSGPMLPQEVGMQVDRASGKAVLQVTLARATAAEFAEKAGAPAGAGWPERAVPTPKAAASDAFVVVIDPGHGGVDPGAVSDGIYEKNLMLSLARDLRDTLRRRGGIEVFLTRDEDVFVSLPERVAFAHRVEADLFVSLHADAIAQGVARGATVYTMADKPSDQIAAQLAAQHDRADIISGLDLSAVDEQVILVLTDLAWRDTQPRTDSFADMLVDQIRAAGAPVHVKPRRGAAFSVLKSPDIPSVLLEVGFLSDARDLKNLRDPIWRQRIVTAMTQAIVDWRVSDAAFRGLARQ